MKNEIIQKFLNKEIYILQDNSDLPLTINDILLDYITNLQEENERLIQGTTLLSNKLIDMTRVKEDYKSRNEKAIEYIKQNSKCGGSFIDNKFVIEYIDEIFNGMELLNILNGDDE